MATLNTNLNITGRAVQTLFEQHLNGSLKVNREYQRKLVWTQPEKESFIQSLLLNLPVPLILAAEVPAEDGHQLEVIDGLQRLNAIFTFIQGDYSVDGKYFDPDTLAETRRLKDEGLFPDHQSLLERSVCITLAAYSIPVSTYRTSNRKEIEEIFRRINSSGRHLSRQEIRQAGSTAPIASLVRRISTVMRGDYSLDDLVDLKDMGKISLSDGPDGPGLDINSVFWVKHGVLNKDDMRRSRDEEVVLDLVASMILGTETNYQSEQFDDYYGLGGNSDAATERKARLDTRLKVVGPDQVEARFKLAKATFESIFDAGSHPFGSHFFRTRKQRVARYFESVFLAIDSLHFDDHFGLFDLQAAQARLKSVGTTNLDIPGGSGTWTGRSKSENVTLVKGLLKPYFQPFSGQSDPALENVNGEVLTLLSASLVEHSRFELKHGLSILTEPPRRNDAIVLEVAQTLSAMANTGRGYIGHVLIGIADKSSDAERVSALSGQDVPVSQPSGRLVTGLTLDSQIHGDIEKVVMWFSNKFREIDISPWFKDQVLDSMRIARIENRDVLKLVAKAGQEPVQTNQKFYRRHGSSTVEVPVSDYSMLFTRFTHGGNVA